MVLGAGEAVDPRSALMALLRLGAGLEALRYCPQRHPVEALEIAAGWCIYVDLEGGWPEPIRASLRAMPPYAVAALFRHPAAELVPALLGLDP